MAGDDSSFAVHAESGAYRRATPAPGVAKPKRGQQVQVCGIGSAIHDGDAREHVVDVGLGILDEDIEVTVLIEDAAVDQLELRLQPVAAAGFLDEPGIRVLELR